MKPCKLCGKPVKEKGRTYCSYSCSNSANSSKPIPDYVIDLGPGVIADQCRKARELRGGGLKIKEIATELECSVSTVQRYLKPDRKPNSKIVPREERTCPICGELFKARVIEKKTYCSAGCYKTFNKNRNENKTCQQCGKTFPVPKSELKNTNGRGKYCSRACYTNAYAPRPRICPTCKRAFVSKRKTEHCSDRCYWIGTEFAPPPLSETSHTCGYCGEEFKRYGENAKYCSSSCSSKAHYKGGFQPAGEQHWNWQGGKVIDTREYQRKSAKYKTWQKRVWQRDNNHCVLCGNGHDETHAHHIYRFAIYPQFRYEVWNGQTLCAECHHKQHPHMRNAQVGSGSSTRASKQNEWAMDDTMFLEYLTTSDHAS